ncbi:PEP-CTERM sorting domain-containing protein [Marinobacter mangrovi]|uniref:PEP-CTERM sorting domain-containing protein n=1 Tax=Marinobacter mangrovi TaxID=2803918 RepID=UPI0019334080|nr:PEP-CTERM sorting domain-containing protein [Marinobacter mangrovi]
MNYLIVGLIASLFSAAALAGAPVEPPTASVPEPGMLGLFAASLTALIIARKFRK